jgi:hypothetical protein
MMFFQVKKSILTACMGAIAFLVVEGVQGIALRPGGPPEQEQGAEEADSGVTEHRTAEQNREGRNKAETASIEFLGAIGAGIGPIRRINRFLSLQGQSHLQETCWRANTRAQRDNLTADHRQELQDRIARLRANPDSSHDSWTLDDIGVLEENGLLGNQREFHVNGRTPEARYEQLNILRKHSAAGSLPSGVTIFMHDMLRKSVGTLAKVELSATSTASSVIVLDFSRNAVTMFDSVKDLISAVEHYKESQKSGVDNPMRGPRFPSHFVRLKLFLRASTNEDIANVEAFSGEDAEYLLGMDNEYHIKYVRENAEYVDELWLEYTSTLQGYMSELS